MKKYIIHSCPSFKDARIKHKILINRDYINNNKKSVFLINNIRNKKVFLKTYGCQANYRDSEKVGSLFYDIGCKIVDNDHEADIIFINSCSVREKSKEKIFGYISSLKNKIIILSGCVIMEENIIQRIIKTSVDIVISMNNISKLFSILKEFFLTKKRIIDINSNFYYIDENLPDTFRESKFKAFVIINYGCNKLCTYCIVPYTRGPERCRLSDDILKECKELELLGYKEIVLLGQNVNSYYDEEKKVSFEQLLDQVASLKIPRVSFLTSHPYDFSLEIVKVMKKHKNILPIIHLPIQSGDDDILRKMGRRYNSSQYIKLISNIRKIIPEISILTDIIVGFPGETEENFLNTLKIVKKIKFDSIFLFIFSKRAGTPASNLIDNTSLKEKKQRFQCLNKIYIEMLEKNNKKYLNGVYDILIEKISEKNNLFLEGRTITNKIVHLSGSSELIGKIVKVKITETHPFFLKGELV